MDAPEESSVSFQKGGQELLKDEKGNLFYGTSRFNPASGDLEAVFAPVSGAPDLQPVGQLSRVDPYGNTADERIDQKGAEAAASKSGSESSRIAAGLFEKTQSIREAFPLYDEAIALAEGGARTGTIQSRLPSLTEKSKLLDQLQRRMGLNVIQNTTFGALSEGELRLALRTAIPTDLEGPALADYFRRKQAAEERLVDYMEWAAIQLDRPEMTTGKFLAQMRDGRLQPPGGGDPRGGKSPMQSGESAPANVVDWNDL
jgi:hypothetical protein